MCKTSLGKKHPILTVLFNQADEKKMRNLLQNDLMIIKV